MFKRYDKLFYETLIAKGLLTNTELDPLLREVEDTGAELLHAVVKHKLLSEKASLEALAEVLKLGFVDLKEATVDRSVLEKIPAKIASYYHFLPLEINDKILRLAVSSPLDIKIQDEIRAQLGYDISYVLALESDISEALKKYYGLAADTLEKISSQAPQDSASSRMGFQEKIEDIAKLADDASVIRLVNQIIVEGWRKRATDIHIEPYRQEVTLRYRIDGILYEANAGPEIKNFFNAIISRFKIMSNLNIVERRLPQDGRAIVKVQDQTLDLRISTIPTPFGESIVVRILPTQMLFSLERLGLSKKDMLVFEGLIQKPHGIVFVTGPTGSGKTTTLYTCLSRINTKERKIITIEDPIEYEIGGVTQIQVQPEIGLDFARGLRSILRHDPDVIMVGEVRDLETAETAVRVALTGHLVFSTLHTNDAASGIARLLDIGVEPYLLASSVEAFVAQRLVRLLCVECKYEDKAASEELKEMIAKDLKLKSSGEIKIFRSKGCPNCNFSGFFGRTAIYEILLIGDVMKEHIIRKTPATQIKKEAMAKGMRTLRQDGWQKVQSGLTTPEEVMKATSADTSDQTAKKPEGPYLSAQAQDTQSKTSAQDKRAYPRLNAKINLRYRVFENEQELIKRGFTPEQLSVTKNISAGGLIFYSQEPLAIGSIIEVIIELPGAEEPIESLARVTRVEEIGGSNRYGIAVCFLDITGAQRTSLNRFVEE
jgi:type II secretory ATPase GspE/PulE/Tfp pilus assembly ATPase PilB-like protein